MNKTRDLVLVIHLDHIHNLLDYDLATFLKGEYQEGKS